MNLQTVASSRPDPVLGVNASANTPDPSSAASSDTFARILDRRVNDTQGASSSVTPPDAQTSHNTQANPANAAPSAPQGKNGDTPDTPPPSPGNVKKDAVEPASTDESAAKKADKPQENTTAAEVAVSPDAAAALAATALPAVTGAMPQVSPEGTSTPRPTNPADSAQTAALAKAPLPSANALPVAAGSDGSAAAVQTPVRDFPTQAAATPAAAESAAVPGSPRAILQAALEKLNVSNPSGRQNAGPQDTESQTLLADTAVTPQEPAGGKHGHSVSALESAISQKDTEPDSGKNVSPDIKPHEQDDADTRLSLAQTNVEPTSSSAGTVTRTDGFVAHPSASTHTPAPSPTVLTVHTPPADVERWASETTQRLVWVAGHGETKAELQLTPPSLGKLEVTLQLNNDQLTAHFVAASQAARDALEHALPQLREQLAQSGLSLGQTSVSTGGGDSNPQSQEDPASGRTVPGPTSRTSANSAPLPLQSTRTGSSLIDHYA